MKIVKSLEDSGLLQKSVSETTRNEAKKQKVGFLTLLLDTSGGNLFGNMLAGKGMNRLGEEIIELVMDLKDF